MANKHQADNPNSQSKMVWLSIHDFATGETEKIQCRHGLGLQAICARFKTPIEFDCRKADCGICIVEVLTNQSSLSKPTPAEADFLRAMNAEPSERLACQCRLLGDATLGVNKFL